MREILIFLIGMSLLLTSCQLPSFLSRKPDERPNFLIIITDDQRIGTMDYMPETQSLIFDQGVTFSRGYVTTPFCCPSRASVLTGMYAHNHEVLTNDDKLNYPTVMEALHANGYYTGLVGKYLNSWKGEQRPEFDYWVSYFKGEVRYTDPPLNVNGKWSKHPGYVSYVLGDYVTEFLDTAAQQPKPFALLFAPNAPHEPVEAAPEDVNLYPDLAPYRPPNFNEADVSDKPSWWQSRPPLTEAEIAEVDTFRRDQILALVSLDRSIGKIMEKLKATGELDNTVVIFLSDNGKEWGEHRMTSKNSPYDETVRVPFAMRYPPLIPQPYTDSRLVGNIDIAPTMYELAELPIPASVDGLSLVKFFDQQQPWRDGLLVEGWPPRGFYAAIYTDKYMYGQTEGDRSELYDLVNDPYQLTNQAENPENTTLVNDLAARLADLKRPRTTPTP